jgi:tRNA(Ile)-lysidine synthase
MADSPTPRHADPVAGPTRLTLAVAYSGGRDSTALLHAAATQAQRLNTAGAELQVLGLHIHHGLSRQADAWLLHCQAQCAAWASAGLPLTLSWRRLDGRPAAAQSVEAWAREARYAALSQMAQEAGADLLLLAHHQRDQAETFVLQALRGAGAAGLAAMPAQQWRDGLCWARPWLSQPREAVEAYVQAHRLSHIEDDSNADSRYARNRLRHAVWPALLAAFPHAETSLAQAANWAQQALALQQELADQDLPPLMSPLGLNVVGVQALSPARASNALRAWLQQQTGRPARASLVQRLQKEWTHADHGHWPCAAGRLELYRGRLSFVNENLAAPSGAPRVLNLGSTGWYAQADWGGGWRVQTVQAGGVSPECLQNIVMRARQGGEQFQRHPASPARSLKKSYQAAAVPARQRQGPLLFVGDVLLFAPGLGLDARWLAQAGVPQCGLSWCADTPELASQG